MPELLRKAKHLCEALSVSEQQKDGDVPGWDLSDRMRKALRHAGVSVQDMADYLEVTRGTVSTWINGRIEPSPQTLRLWALRCGVSYDWLRGDYSPHVRRARAVTVLGFRKPGRTTRTRNRFEVAA
jgi:transcriptional regulator with XRE-family HTH domain